MNRELLIALVMWTLALVFGCIIGLIYNNGYIGLTAGFIMVILEVILLVIYSWFEEEDIDEETYY